MDKELVGAVQHKMDNQSKATPRPWRIVPATHGCFFLKKGIQKYYRVNGKIVCFDNLESAKIAKETLEKPETVEVSKVIYEALLEACRKALACLKCENQLLDNGKYNYQVTIDALIQAIANAEGR